MAKISQAELEALARRDPLSFGIQHIDLLEDKKWEVSTRQWSIEPYSVLNPYYIEKRPVGMPRRMSVIKSTQAGVSVMMIVKMFHFAYNWSIRAMYGLPRQQDTIDFVGTRIDPIIASSPLLSKVKGMPDSLHTKRIGNSYIFFMEMTTEPRSLPADVLYLDEVDLCDPDNLSTALNRLDASRWKLNYFLSTPTVSNYGIDALYKDSDMREWLVKCPKCGEWQMLDWEVNLRVVGNPNDPTEVFYGCEKCNAELTVPHIQTGKWVPQKPGRSSEHVGFHISQMYTTPARDLYRIFRDPQTKIEEFYRKRLGKPYEIGGGSIERDDFLVNCFIEPYEFEEFPDGTSSYYIGADQGNELQVLVAKVEKDSRYRKIVHIERIPLDKGFDRLSQLIVLFRAKRVVGDANPNRHEMLKLQKRFPGRVILADYAEQKAVWTTKRADPKSKVITNVTINRTTGLDGVMESIKDGQWLLPGMPPRLHEDVETVIDQVTALKRDVENRKTAAGEVPVAVYRKIRADHFGHSWLYLKTAVEIDRGKTGKLAILGGVQQEEEQPEEDDPDKPDTDIIVGIVADLAEVPKEQIIEYLATDNDPDYEVPFPLSFKLSVAQDKFDMQDILWVMEKVLTKGL